MKRLTFEGNFCDIAMCMVECGGEFCRDGNCSQKKTWERLKYYEDLEEQGRLLVLPPCKVGDIVYVNFYGRVVETTVKSIQIGLHGKLYLTTGMYAPWVEDMGKTWFLTKEDAERAIGGNECP